MIYNHRPTTLLDIRLKNLDSFSLLFEIEIQIFGFWIPIRYGFIGGIKSELRII